jgi:hypothetical protein
VLTVRALRTPLTDVVHHVRRSRFTWNASQLVQYNLQASFLEVYGEDVHDLLDKSRQSLPLREDAEGGIVITGLTTRAVANADAALAVLHEGTLNRTTAATLMKLTSSRSHAVFTVTLQQVLRNSNNMDVTTTSRKKERACVI